MNDNNQNVWDNEVLFDDFASLFPNVTKSPFYDDDLHPLDLTKTSSYYVDDFSPLPPDPFLVPPPPPPPPPQTTAISSSSTASDACWPVLINTNDSGLQQMQMPAHFYGTTTTESNNNNNNAFAGVPIALPGDSSSSTNIDCLKVLEDFKFMDVNNVMDEIDFWDSSSSSSSCSILQEQMNKRNKSVLMGVAAQQQQQQPEQEQHQMSMQNSSINVADDQDDGDKDRRYTGMSYFLQGESELSAIFLEWVMKHKHSITADELINIKLKRSTIETASKQLGNTKQGKKLLLKLILRWIDHNHLSQNNNPTPPYLQHHQYPAASGGQSPNFIPPPAPQLNFTPSTWIHPPTPYQTHSAAPQPYAYANPAAYHPIPIPSSSSSSSIGYAYDPNYYWNKTLNANNCVINPNPLSSSSVVPHPHSQAQLQQVNNSFWVNNNHQAVISGGSSNNNNSSSSNGGGVGVGVGGGAYQHQQVMVYGENGGAKEARMRRMARQKRQLGLGVHHNNHHNQVNLCSRNYSQAAAAPPHPLPNLASYNWRRRQTTDQLHPPADAHPPHYQVNNAKKKKEDVEENKMQLILQKVLKQSDVGNLGRIVLPKREAEMHLPQLITGDGIPITVEDISTSNVWTLRYRFWPNNNSRMYLFENTGEFVRANDLEEGDLIALYLDTKTCKYMIKGMKIHPSSSSETKAKAKADAANNKHHKTTKKGRNSGGTHHRSTSGSKRMEMESSSS